MATLTLLSSLSLRSSSSSSSSSFTLSSSFSSPSSFAFFCSFPLRSATSSLKVQTIQKKKRVVKAVEEDTQQELNAADDSEQPSTSEAPPVVVPVSPSDTLTMFFQAEGTVSETAIPALTKALEETEGVTDLKVQLAEGLAILELKKQTTVQATGVASSLVETIQGSGFKLQTLNLSFEDEEVAVA
ncbi:hypothetical protein AAZX31_13G055700 [Glycine max]|uniref:Uncharacterized protein n=2 Tax=Glycine subgen. Soja TaxID=1462606 RepID=I1LWE3_SOYBN|nr:uncharacterized protein LOC100500408 [Glycine max]XP_028197576.1 uncharacterized protein LOC114382390 [Glycine soja]KAG4976185.1 hypothetical protein JHK86_035659 [Glycine max]KAG5112261.1 hypothetical protein JHK82_035530 [Glycine max]KAG5129540.1 hypothetical protein JHK84_035937 [Glycine max]KAH1100214.1 hypothetical protein GYH30_035395 [Glycine max]KAH1215817.1 hypothetical protein GmHk_13G036878 [Glycine max]|eukprot:NP_001237590.2 uncharacterized protein LOC100500408 [Glycine max]